MEEGADGWQFDQRSRQVVVQSSSKGSVVEVSTIAAVVAGMAVARGVTSREMDGFGLRTGRSQTCELDLRPPPPNSMMIDPFDASTTTIGVENCEGLQSSFYIGDDSEGNRERATGKRRKNYIPKKFIAQKKVNDTKISAPGDLMGDCQESILVNKQSVGGHSTLETKLVTQSQGDTSMKRLDEHGPSSSQNQHDETGTEHETLFSNAIVDVARDLIVPLSSVSHSSSALPFEKRCPIWKYIDQEITPKLRQQPHFRPLDQLPEVEREGFAVGLMVTFEQLMSNKSLLKMDASCHELDVKLKRVIDLEEHGFEVQHFRAHLEKLVQVKSKRKQLLRRMSDTKENVLERSQKRARLNAEFEAADKAFMALKQALDLFGRRKTSLSIQKEECETVVTNLNDDLKLAAEELASTERTFQELLTVVP